MGKINPGYTIVYSRRAIHDLDEISDYISEILQNPPAALNTVRKIQHTINKLADFPRIGTLLSDVDDIMDSDYRFLVCANYLAFYRVAKERVYIDRIMYGRRDYVTILFPNLRHD
ncbi:MAG: type II toxin-antitoxin system RelE/ParE family toxin [Deferribacteraceae bacterium]|nr:type II toxin-antitoxin system RelE/ParE family toxin [Deferribacteraceae bacterium]